MLPAAVLRSPTVRRELVLLAAIVLVGAFFASASPYFLTTNNLTQIWRVSVDLAVVSAGMTIVIIMGGIDVGVGGILAVAAIFIGRAYQAGLPDLLVVPIGLGVGALLGSANGLLCARLRIPPIIATLGTMYIWLATLFLAIGGEWIAGLPGTLSPLINGSVFGIPSPLLIVAGVYGLCGVLLTRLPFGRHVYAIGCDEAAARLAGVNVERVKLVAYSLLGFLAGFAALLYVTRLRNVEINIGTNIALEAIAATILGGASIRGGIGSLFGTLLGVVFIKMIQNGLVLVGISSLWERVVIGGLLVLVLVLEGLRQQHLLSLSLLRRQPA
jgi:ribose/xylose/arabinose/galactoside ABC-type transport system permease subunit